MWFPDGISIKYLPKVNVLQELVLCWAGTSMDHPNNV